MPCIMLGLGLHNFLYFMRILQMSGVLGMIFGVPSGAA
jgi:hypothetical protein